MHSKDVVHLIFKWIHLIQIIILQSIGKVQLASCKRNGILYALKSIKKSKIEDTNTYKNIIKERDILFKLDHPFIVSAKFYFQNEKKIFIGLDFISGGDLATRIDTETNFFTESRVRFYAAQIALALGYIHELGYIYRDLKPENILINSDGYIKLTDFGFATTYNVIDDLNENNNNNSTFCGTFEYISPEMISNSPYNKNVDWWSFGILVYKMLFKITPFYNQNSSQTMNSILTEIPEYPCRNDVSTNAIEFIDDLLQKKSK